MRNLTVLDLGTSYSSPLCSGFWCAFPVLALTLLFSWSVALSPSLVIINANPPIRNALNSVKDAFSYQTSIPPNEIKISPITVVFGFLKILSIISNISVPTPKGVHERGQHHKQTRYLMHLGQRQPTYGQRPTCRYCACTIVFHSSMGYVVRMMLRNCSPTPQTNERQSLRHFQRVYASEVTSTAKPNA